MDCVWHEVKGGKFNKNGLVFNGVLKSECQFDEEGSRTKLLQYFFAISKLYIVDHGCGFSFPIHSLAFRFI